MPQREIGSRMLGSLQLDCSNLALAQACALYSPFPGILSDIEIYRR